MQNSENVSFSFANVRRTSDALFITLEVWRKPDLMAGEEQGFLEIVMDDLRPALVAAFDEYLDEVQVLRKGHVPSIHTIGSGTIRQPEWTKDGDSLVFKVSLPSRVSGRGFYGDRRQKIVKEVDGLQARIVKEVSTYLKKRFSAAVAAYKAEMATA